MTSLQGYVSIRHRYKVNPITQYFQNIPRTHLFEKNMTKQKAKITSRDECIFDRIFCAKDWKMLV